jgi:hypothetical protein
MTQQQILQEIDKLDIKLMELTLAHWIRFGHFGTWQFWINVVFFILPLIITYILIDRKKIFQVAFYGYSFHVMFVYLDVFFSRFNFWDHPYLMIPIIPVSIPVDASLVPVTFMLAYQFAINHNKNFYLTILITATFVTLIAWIWQLLGLLKLYNGMNLFHIFLCDVGIAILAYWFTNLFLRLKKQSILP